MRSDDISYEFFERVVVAGRKKTTSRRASFTTCVVELTIISARIFFRSSTVEFLEMTNLYSASKKVNFDSASEDVRDAD